MRYLVLLVILLRAMPSWGSGPDPQQTAMLAEYLQKGTVREKILALSQLPKPNCGEEPSPEKRMVLHAMQDRDPLVREMATFYVRYEITEQGPSAATLSDEEYFPLSPSTPNVGDNEISLPPGGSGRSECRSKAVTEAFLHAAADAVPRVKMEGALGLAFTGDRDASATLAKLAGDTDPFVRAAAAFALGKLHAKEEAQALASLAVTATGDWRDFFARREALKALRTIWIAGFRRTVEVGPEGNVAHDTFDEPLRKLAVATALGTLDDAALRREAYELLAEMKAPEALTALRAGAADSDPLVRVAALRSLLRLAGDAACSGCEATFTASAADSDARVRAAAVRGLGRISGTNHNQILLKGIDDPDEDVRKAAVASVRSADPQSLEKLASVLNANQPVRSSALASLYRATRTEADFAAVRARRQPAQARIKRSYIWIEPDPDHLTKKSSASRKKPVTPDRIRNNAVVERIMAAYPLLARHEKMYALELLGRFNHPGVAPFLIASIDDPDPVASVKAMETAIAYAPEESLQTVAARLTANNERVRGAAYRMIAELDIDFPVAGLAPLAENPSPKTRKMFFELVKGQSDPLLPSLCLKGLGDPDVAVRTAAAGCFETHADHRAVEPLTAMLKRTSYEKHVAVGALAAQDESALAPLLSVITERNGAYDAKDRIEALFGVVNYDRERIAPALLDLLEKSPDPGEPVTDNVIRALVGIGERRVVPLLLNYLRQDKGKGSIAVYALFVLADPSASGPLRQIIEGLDQPLERRKMAIFAYASGGAEATRCILEAARQTPELRKGAVERLQIQKPEDRRVVADFVGRDPEAYRDLLTAIPGASGRIPVEQTADLLHDKEASVVKGAVLLLRASGNPEAIEPLRAVATAPDPSLRELAAEAVQYLERKKGAAGARPGNAAGAAAGKGM